MNSTGTQTLGPTSLAALRHIRTLGAASSSDLRAAGITEGRDASKVLSNLAKGGYVQRPLAGTFNGYGITDKGRAAIGEPVIAQLVQTRIYGQPLKAPKPKPTLAQLIADRTPLQAQRRGHYDPRADAMRAPARPGATDADRCPSRRADGWHWRDGRHERGVA